LAVDVRNSAEDSGDAVEGNDSVDDVEVDSVAPAVIGIIELLEAEVVDDFRDDAVEDFDFDTESVLACFRAAIAGSGLDRFAAEDFADVFTEMASIGEKF